MPEKGIVLLVEDDAAVQRTNRRILERDGFTVLCATTLAEARAHLAVHEPDVLVLDILLPDGNGLAFCREIRPTIAAPVLFLTALDERHEIVRGLKSGGNDYITKPYNAGEFALRVRANYEQALRLRRDAGKARTLTFGPLSLDVAAQHAFRDGEDMLLTPKEFALLLVLAQNEGEAISAQDLYERAWKAPMAGDANAVRVAVSRLRTKLAGSVYTLHMTRGKGYLFDREKLKNPE